MTTDPTKAALRRDIAARLAAMTDEDRRAQSAALCAWLDAVLSSVTTGVLMGFLPLPGEVDPTCAMQRWLDGGGTIAAPCVDWTAGSMQPGLLPSLDPSHLRPGPHGTREPILTEPVSPASLHALLVPGLAFDEAGHRLGRGGGFYDRLLADLPSSIRRIGVCFDLQMIDCVPVDDHDQRVDLVVHPAGVVEAG